MIRILLADDHPLVRDGLRALLAAEDDLEIAAEAEDYHQLLERVDERVDVVVTDIAMPGPGVDRALGDLGAQWPGVRVLLISLCEQSVLHERAQRLGAHGSLDKSRAKDELADAIRAVASGNTYPPGL